MSRKKLAREMEKAQLSNNYLKQLYLGDKMRNLDKEEKQYRKVEKWGKEKKGDKLGAYLEKVGKDKTGGVLDVLGDKKTRKDDFL